MRLKTAAVLLYTVAATDNSQFCADGAVTSVMEWAAAPSDSLFASAYATSSSNSFTPLCCNALAEADLAVLYPGEATYKARVKLHWSRAAQLTPSCFVEPHSAVEVARAVTALVNTNKTHQCHFAVRSGGHTTWAGAANIEDGVTIDLSMMNSTTYYAKNNTAAVLPGARWKSVYSYLDAYGVAVAGGRASTVGVAGLVLGGGNSFYAGQKGMVCDNVVQFEVVTGNGEIIYANNETNSDLFQALKGGSNNFGIVTRLDLATFEDGKLWGGVVTYPNSTTPHQLQALVNFNDRIEKDPYGSVIGIWQYSTLTNATIIINAYEYTKPVKKPAAFDEFYAILGNTSDSMRITNMTDITIELEQAAGYRDTFITLTFENDVRVLQKAIDLHNILVSKLSSVSGDWTMQNMFQPIPAVFAKHSVENGGNVLGLDRYKKNLFLFQIYLAWNGAKQDDFLQRTGDWLISELDTYAQSIGKANPYIYLDYAYKTQKPLESYGKENVKKIRAAAKKYDPEGVFQTMVPGGFKISKVRDK
ncbi:MAG: hypothetical protein M1830_005645 [Pleopsidium flavum]|nr:MAG: hypothetical protein M1830_005645 [Pleopsidium flavum]